MSVSGKGVILVVDDEPAIREFVALALQAEGYTVHQAAEGGEALETLARVPVGLILLDLRMPGMSGGEFLDAHRERGGTAPVVLLAAVGQEELDQLEPLAAEVLRKPFGLAELLSVVERRAT